MEDLLPAVHCPLCLLRPTWGESKSQWFTVIAILIIMMMRVMMMMEDIRVPKKAFLTYTHSRVILIFWWASLSKQCMAMVNGHLFIIKIEFILTSFSDVTIFGCFQHQLSLCHFRPHILLCKSSTSSASLTGTIEDHITISVCNWNCTIFEEDIWCCLNAS